MNEPLPLPTAAARVGFLYFAQGDNDDLADDYIGWYSGNDATAGNGSVLEVISQ